MAEGPGEPRSLGYCTNVHAGETLERTREGLERHALAVRRLHCPGRDLDVGLWLSAHAARQALETGGARPLAGWLAERGLRVFTLNGFPWGDFHKPVVKHDVYRPDWREQRRLDYTLDLARILAALIPEGAEGGISTLPVGWEPSLGDTDIAAAASNLRLAAAALHELHSQTGRLIHLDLEPEPGCVLQKSADVVEFFEDHLSGNPGPDILRRHLRVCHDVCHAAVMYEEQAAALDRYHAAEILVGKVQASSALRVRFAEGETARAMAELKRFAEPRYLHQTGVRGAATERLFYEDLPEALAAAGRSPAGEWRVHFHVPVYLERIGVLETTSGEIDRCFKALRRHPEIRHVEVETYAWDVLPPELRRTTLAESIAAELDWCRNRLDVEAEA